MKSETLDLRELASEKEQRVVARLEGELDEATASLWGSEFAASGGKMPPTPPPTERR